MQSPPPPVQATDGQVGAVSHELLPEQLVTQAHELEQSMPLTQEFLPEQVTSHRLSPQVIAPEHDPLREQLTVQESALVQSMPPAQEPEPPQRTEQSQPAGQTTREPHDPVPLQLIVQTVPLHEAHSGGQTAASGPAMASGVAGLASGALGSASGVLGLASSPPPGRTQKPSVQVRPPLQSVWVAQW